MNIYLYHKRHKQTGLNYFGKTKQDPYTYQGSGKYWHDHLRIHGKDIETVQVWEFSDLDECSEFALAFSAKHNIVESDSWANLREENGRDGGDTLSLLSAERLTEIKENRSNIQSGLWQSRDKEKASATIAAVWGNRDADMIHKIANKISTTLRNKTPEERAITAQKRKVTESKRLAVTCPHCGLYNAKGKTSNMTRYHFSNCKNIKSSL